MNPSELNLKSEVAILWGMNRRTYLSDVSDEEWAFVAPYLTLMTEDAPQRDYPLREVFNGLRYVVRGGIAWHMMPNDLPPRHTVYQRHSRACTSEYSGVHKFFCGF